MNNEFNLITRYFSRPAPVGYLGIGDDCAMLPVAAGHHLATSTDLLIENRHFLSDVDPESLGHKALAVNLSDLAAMGAQPLACLLGLSLPDINHEWLQGFSSGFHALAERAQCPLIGGDTTRSSAGVVISVTVMGQVRPELALRRDAAKLGDDIWVTGTLAGPDIALRLLQKRLPENHALLAATRDALERPLPPWRFGQQLAGIAHAALDISDGLMQDLGHILKASRCGADVYFDALPLHPAVQGLDQGLLQSAALAGGDVYQLCFTAAASDRARIQGMASDAAVQLTRIGKIIAEPDLRVWAADGSRLTQQHSGFDHFS